MFFARDWEIKKCPSAHAIGNIPLLNFYFVRVCGNYMPLRWLNVLLDLIQPRMGLQNLISLKLAIPALHLRHLVFFNA